MRHEAPLHVVEQDDPGEPRITLPFEGMSHAEVLALELPAERFLVDGLIPIGVVGTIAGVPETHKSWLAQAIAVRVAAGHGQVLGRDIVHAAPVGYFWQDDSTREEAERVKLFQQVHKTDEQLPLRWFLNEGLELPRDLDRLRATIQHHQLGLVVLDSFYNVAGAADLKDNDAEQIVGLQKRELADPTGCTILNVDHMPWATETNRGRLRTYGGVFKNAATRFGIYIDAQGNKLSIEARGNNIPGFKKTPATWDPETLELRLIDTSHTDHDAKVDERADTVLAWLNDHPGQHSGTTIRKAVGGRESITDEALERLKARAEVQDHGRDGGPWSGKSGDGRYWISSIHATPSLLDTPAHTDGPRSAEDRAQGIERQTSAPRPAPYRGAEV